MGNYWELYVNIKGKLKQKREKEIYACFRKFFQGTWIMIIVLTIMA
jgi:hypothetical protein